MTHAEARRAIRWFQKRFGITDWKIMLDFQDSQPDWVRENGLIADSLTNITSKRARIWISPTRAQEDKSTLLENLFHECFHVASHDIGLPHPTTEHVEYFVNRFGAVCETAYLAEQET